MLSDSDGALLRLAGRLRHDRRFIAYALASFQHQEELDIEQLADSLRIPPVLLLRLALCRRPNSESEQFAQQVREVADYTLTDDAQLANLLRQVDAIEKLRELERSTLNDAGESLTGLLAAARDRAEGEDQQSESESSDPNAGTD
jgi:hypothetical protein